MSQDTFHRMLLSLRMYNKPKSGHEHREVYRLDITGHYRFLKDIMFPHH